MNQRASVRGGWIPALVEAAAIIYLWGRDVRSKGITRNLIPLLPPRRRDPIRFIHTLVRRLRRMLSWLRWAGIL